jgi:hypothetical protein
MPALSKAGVSLGQAAAPYECSIAVTNVAARTSAKASGESEQAFPFNLKAYPNPSASGIFQVECSGGTQQ